MATCEQANPLKMPASQQKTTVMVVRGFMETSMHRSAFRVNLPAFAGETGI